RQGSKSRARLWAQPDRSPAGIVSPVHARSTERPAQLGAGRGGLLCVVYALTPAVRSRRWESPDSELRRPSAYSCATCRTHPKVLTRKHEYSQNGINIPARSNPSRGGRDQALQLRERNQQVGHRVVCAVLAQLLRRAAHQTE